MRMMCTAQDMHGQQARTSRSSALDMVSSSVLPVELPKRAKIVSWAPDRWRASPCESQGAGRIARYVFGQGETTGTLHQGTEICFRRRRVRTGPWISPNAASCSSRYGSHPRESFLPQPPPSSIPCSGIGKGTKKGSTACSLFFACLAGGRGFEPPTPGFGGLYSIQLS